MTDVDVAFVAFPAVGTAVVTRKFRFMDRKTYGFTGGFHMGVDFAAQVGSPIYAAAGGEVVEAGYQTKGGYGRRVVLKHESGFLTLYAHLHTVKVSLGDVVEAGEEIGTMGGNVDDPYRGASSGTHLHFEVILPHEPDEPFVKTYKGFCVDPLPWLAKQFLPPAKYRGRVEVVDGVRVRTSPSVQHGIRVDALGYKAQFDVLDTQKDSSGNVWAKRRSVRTEWVAVMYAGSRLLSLEDLGGDDDAENYHGDFDAEKEALIALLTDVSNALAEMTQWIGEKRAWIDGEKERLRL